MIRTLLVLEGRLVRGALAYLLSAQPDMEVIGELDEDAEVEAAITAKRPDVTVVDLDIVRIRDLHRVCAGGDEPRRSRILALLERRQAGQMATLMARHRNEIGFVGMDACPQRVIDSVRRLARGETVLDSGLVAAALGTDSPLTVREYEVLKTAAEGLPVREIATKFGLSPGTVRNHLSRIVAKTGALNRVQAVKKAREFGWI
jgi:two-component system, NarL family, response regulator DesR